MENVVRIPCELLIVPGNSTTQNKVILRADGVTVFAEYEDSLTAAQLDVSKQIVEAMAKSLSGWADSRKSQ